MDCVEGIQGKNEPVLLTLQIVEIKFLFAFLLDRHNSECVIEKLRYFKNLIALDTLMDFLLTDNGHEFLDLENLMLILDKTEIFYCHPYSSFEKGSIENNHELIRRIIPKGVSLKAYHQEDINTIINHINSLYREELNNKCPFELVNKYLSEESLTKLGLTRIDDRNVMLIPELLGDRNIQNIKKYLSDDDIKKANIKFKD